MAVYSEKLGLIFFQYYRAYSSALPMQTRSAVVTVLVCGGRGSADMVRRCSKAGIPVWPRVNR